MKMGERPSYNLRSSSQRSISAFSESFSCGEFGAFDMDLDEADYEAMAQEAEAKAQERIHQSKTVIDGLLEGEECSCGSGGGGSSARQSLPRGGGPRGGGGGLAQMENSRQNRSKRWEPQKIFEDEGEERDNNNQFRQISTRSRSEAEASSKTLVISDEEISISSNDLKRKESSNSDQDRVTSEASVVGSVGAGKSTFSTSSNGTNEKRGMVLAPTHPGAPNGGIHINAPNVTINYIIEQRVESRAPPEGRVNIDVSSDPSSYAGWLKSGSGGSFRVGEENNGNIKGNSGRAVKDEDVHMPTKEALVQQTIHEDQVPNFIHQSPHDNNVPQYVTPVPAMSKQRGHVARGDQGQNLDDLNKETVEDFNASQMTMSSCWSKKGEHTVSTSSVMSASLSPIVNVAERNMSERLASEKSVKKTVKVAPAPSSQPYDLSELLDSLWSPENPNPLAKPDAASVSKSLPRSRSSSEESVYTAGVNSFYSPEQGADLKQATSKDLSKLSQIAEGGISKDQATSRSDGDIHSASWTGPTSKTSSESLGGNIELYSEGRASRLGAKWEERGNRAQILDLSSKSRSRSQEKASDGTKASSVSSHEEMGEENENTIAIARNSPQTTFEGGELNGQSGQSRSISRGKSKSQERVNDCDSSMSNFTSKGGGGISTQEGLGRGQQVSFSNAPPSKVSMRNLLETCESDRDLSVYVDEDLSTTDIDIDPLVKKTNPGSQMGVISEVSDGGSVGSSVPEYKIDPGVAAFAKSFVDGFSKLEDNKKQSQASIDDNNISVREDGSDRSAVEEVEAKGNSPKRNSNRRASACGRIESKERSMQHKNSPKIPRLQSRGESQMQNSTKTRTQGQPQRPRSKSMKMRPTSQFVHPAMNGNDHDQSNSPHTSHTQDQSQRAGRSKSSKPRPPRQLVHQPAMNDNLEDQRNVLSLSRLQRCPGSSRRLSGGLRDSQSTARISNTKHCRHSDDTVPISNVKYSLGDLLRNEKDIIRDSNVENILNLKPFDYCMVRRSGGRWSYSIVAEVNENEMKFVLDKEGSKKKIERHGLLHNVRRLKE